MGITVLTGAGAVIEIGAPTTAEITTEVEKLTQSVDGKTYSLIKNVADQLREYYKPSIVNFEDIYHALEQLYTYFNAWKKKPRKEYKPAFGALSQLKDESFFQNETVILKAKQDLIEKVASLIVDYDNHYQENADNKWYDGFWRELAATSELDICTTNYDTTFDRLFPNYTDGYESTGNDYLRFNPKQLNADGPGKILHLHGCINYGYGTDPDVSQQEFADHYLDLHRFDSYAAARRSWEKRIGTANQAGDRINIGPIITGMYKPDKLQVAPYIFYSAELLQAIQRNSALLIVGYSFGDRHINSIIERMASIHGKDRRIVVITWMAGAGTDRDFSLLNAECPIPVEFAQKAFQEVDVAEYKGPVKDDLKSRDGCCWLFFNGFKDAVDNHSKDIRDFLNS